MGVMSSTSAAVSDCQSRAPSLRSLSEKAEASAADARVALPVSIFGTTAACRSEWRLIAASHDLLTLWHHAPAAG